MAKPNSARSAMILVERELKQKMVMTCESEQRTKLLQTLLRMGLMTKEMESSNRKQMKSKMRSGEGNMFKSSVANMKGRISYSRKEGDKFRKERNELREQLEEGLDKEYYKKVMKKLKAKVLRIKTLIQKKNKEKISRYKEDRDEKQLDELSSLREEMGEFGSLRVFNNIPIQPEGRKPPVVGSDEISLSEDEISLLSRGPKFTLRNVINKEIYMAELEKGYVKKKFGDIDKEEIDGKTITEEPLNEEDKRVMDEADWHETKSELVYDFEQKNLDFG
jgi:hypothetical protein